MTTEGQVPTPEQVSEIILEQRLARIDRSWSRFIPAHAQAAERFKQVRRAFAQHSARLKWLEKRA